MEPPEAVNRSTNRALVMTILTTLAAAFMMNFLVTPQAAYEPHSTMIHLEECDSLLPCCATTADALISPTAGLVQHPSSNGMQPQQQPAARATLGISIGPARDLTAI